MRVSKAINGNSIGSGLIVAQKRYKLTNLALRNIPL